jgi:hypothetical protein
VHHEYAHPKPFAHSLGAAALRELSLPKAALVLRYASASVTAQVCAGGRDEARKEAAAKLAKSAFGWP